MSSDGKPIKVLLIDSEGLGSFEKDVSATHDTTIFSLCVLLCSTLLFNGGETITEDSIQSLSFIANLTQHIRVGEDSGDSSSSADLQPFFPSFIWLLRDFALKLVDKEGMDITLDEYLENALQRIPGFSAEVDARNRPRDYLRAFFKQRTCKSLVMPAPHEQLQNLDTLPDEDLNPAFVQGMQELRDLVFGQAKPKTVGGDGRPVTGPILAQLVGHYVAAINADAVPAISDAWTAATESETRRALENAEADFARAVKAAAPIPLSEEQPTQEEAGPLILPKDTPDLEAYLLAAEQRAMGLFKDQVPMGTAPQIAEAAQEKLTAACKTLAQRAREANASAAQRACEDHVASARESAAASALHPHRAAVDAFKSDAGNLEPQQGKHPEVFKAQGVFSSMVVAWGGLREAYGAGARGPDAVKHTALLGHGLDPLHRSAATILQDVDSANSTQLRSFQDAWALSQSEVASLKQDLEQVRAELDASNSERAAAEARAAKASEELAATSTQLADSRKTVSELRKVCAELQADVESGQAALAAEQRTHGETKAALESEEQRARDLTAKLKETSAAAGAAAAEASASQQQVASLRDKLTHARASADAKAESLGSTEKRLEEARAKYSQEADARREAELQLIKTQRDLAEAEAQLASLQTESAELKGSAGSKETELASLRAAEAASQKRIRDLMAAKNLADMELAAAQQELQRCKGELESLEQEQRTTKARAQSLETDLAASQQEAKASTEKAESLKAALEQAQTDTQRRLAEVREELVSVQAAHNSSAKQTAGLEEQLQQAQAECSQLEGQLQAAKARCDSLSSEVEDLTRQHSGAAASKATAEKDAEEARAELQKAKAEAARLVADLETTQEELAAAQAQNAALQHDCTSAQGGEAAASARVQHLEQEVLELKQSVQSAEQATREAQLKLSEVQEREKQATEVAAANAKAHSEHLEQLQQQLGAAVAAHAHCSDAQQALRAQLEQSQARHAALREEMAKTIAVARDTAQAADDEVARLRATSKKAREALGQERARHSATKAALAEAQQESDATARQVAALKKQLNAAMARAAQAVESMSTAVKGAAEQLEQQDALILQLKQAKRDLRVMAYRRSDINQALAVLQQGLQVFLVKAGGKLARRTLKLSADRTCLLLASVPAGSTSSPVSLPIAQVRSVELGPGSPGFRVALGSASAADVEPSMCFTVYAARRGYDMLIARDAELPTIAPDMPAGDGVWRGSATSSLAWNHKELLISVVHGIKCLVLQRSGHGLYSVARIATRLSLLSLTLSARAQALGIPIPPDAGHEAVVKAVLDHLAHGTVRLRRSASKGAEKRGGGAGGQAASGHAASPEGVEDGGGARATPA